MDRRQGITFSSAALVFGLALLAACAQPPTQDMKDAELSIDKAIQAGAEEYASDDLSAAQESFADAKAKMESKDYKGAKQAAQETKSFAEEALKAVDPNKKAAQSEAQGRMAILKQQLDAFQAKASKARGKDAADVKAKATSLGELWTGVQLDFDKGLYVSALDKMDDLQDQMEESVSTDTAKSPDAER
jgi:hypothetical protein